MKNALVGTILACSLSWGSAVSAADRISTTRSPAIRSSTVTIQRLGVALDVCIQARDYCRADRDWWVDRTISLEEIIDNPAPPCRTAPGWVPWVVGAAIGLAAGSVGTVVVLELAR